MAKIVILGGGFAGMHAAKTLLSKVNNSLHTVTLISREKDFVFTPLLHEVEIGLLEAEDVTQDIAMVLKAKNFAFHHAEIMKIDFQAKTVHTSTGNVEYDYLLVALGSVINKNVLSHLKIPEENLFWLKSLQDSLRIKKKLNELASKYLTSKSEKKAISIMFVGAGATAMEVIGEVSDFYKSYFKNFGKPQAFSDVSIYAIEIGNKILPMVNDAFRERLMPMLKEKHIKIFTNAKITSYENGKVEIDSDGKKQKLGVSIVFLSAGVLPNPCEAANFQKNEKGSYDVDEFLQVKGLENVWAAGDDAFYLDPVSGRPVPMLAQSAKYQGIAAGKNIAAKINETQMEKYIFQSKGFILSVGQNFAVGDIYGRLMSGWHIWWLKRTVYTMEFFGFWCRFRKFWLVSVWCFFRHLKR